jgi:magnesium-transporting ATPase (P-type)
LGDKRYDLDKKSYDDYSQEIKVNSNDSKTTNLFRCLCLCHDVVLIEDDQKNKSLSGASPDEVTFLEMCDKVKIA